MPCKVNLNAARNIITVFSLVTRSIRKWRVSIFKTMPKIAIYKDLTFYFFTADWLAVSLLTCMSAIRGVFGG